MQSRDSPGIKRGDEIKRAGAATPAVRTLQTHDFVKLLKDMDVNRKRRLSLASIGPQIDEWSSYLASTKSSGRFSIT
jgi:hypothetical protein